MNPDQEQRDTRPPVLFVVNDNEGTITGITDYHHDVADSRAELVTYQAVVTTATIQNFPIPEGPIPIDLIQTKGGDRGFVIRLIALLRDGRQVVLAMDFQLSKKYRDNNGTAWVSNMRQYPEIASALATQQLQVVGFSSESEVAQPEFEKAGVDLVFSSSTIDDMYALLGKDTNTTYGTDHPQT